MWSTNQALGSTEGGIISNMVGREECHRIKSTGRLCSGVEAKVVDIINGELLPTNEQGELYIRGPSVMLGNYITTSVHLLMSSSCIDIYLLHFENKDGTRSNTTTLYSMYNRYPKE